MGTPLQTLGTIEAKNTAADEQAATNASAATLASTEAATVPAAFSTPVKTLLSNSVKTIAGMQNLLGFEGAADKTMTEMSQMMGFTSDLQVDTEGGDVQALAQYILPSALGSYAFKAVTAFMRGNAAAGVSNLIAKPSLAKTLSYEGGELLAQNLPITLGDVTTAGINDEGKLKSKTDTENYLEALNYNLIGDAAISAAGTSAAMSSMTAYRTYKTKKSIEGKNYGEYNIDEKGAKALNVEVAKGAIDPETGKYTPKFRTEEAISSAPAGKTMEDVFNEGNFDGMISYDGSYYKVNDAGEVVKGTSNGEGIIEFEPEAPKFSNGGFITLDTFNGMVGRNYKSINEIQSKTPFAVIDKDGNFRVQNERQGDIYGKEFSSGRKVLDLRKSKVNTDAYGMMYGNKHLIRGMDDQAIKIISAFEQLSDVDKEALYTEISRWAEVDENGNISLKEDVKNDFLHRIREGENFDKIMRDENIQLIDSAKIKPFGEGDVVTTTRDRNINAQIFTALDYNSEAIKGTDLGLWKAFTEEFEGMYSSKANMAVRSFDMENFSGSYADRIKELFNVSEVDGKLQVTSMKPELAKALDSAYAITLATMDDVNGLVDMKSLDEQVVNKAFDLLGIKDLDGELSGIKQDIVRQLRDSNVVDTPSNGTAELTVVNGKVFKGGQPNEELTSLLKILGKDTATRQDNLSKLMDHGNTSEKRGATTTGEAGFVKNKYNIDDPIAQKLALDMANTRYDISNTGQKIIDRFVALANSEQGDYVRFTSGDKQLGMYFGLIKPDDVVSEWSPNAKHDLRDALDDARREVFALDRLRNDYDPDLGIHYDVEIDNNTRARYTDQVNPQNSNLARIALTTGDRMLSLKDANGDLIAKNVETAKRSMLQNFGIKVERIPDMNVINDLYTKLEGALLDKNGNIKTGIYNGKGVVDITKLDKFIKAFSDNNLEFDVEKIISVAAIEQVKDIGDVLHGRTDKAVDVFAEIDSKQSGIALTLGMLGYADHRVGIGGFGKEVEVDIYEQLQSKLQHLGLTRAEVKPAVIGDNYLASPYISAQAIAKSVLNNFFKTGNMNPTMRASLKFFNDTHTALFEGVKKKQMLIDQIKELKRIMDENPDMPVDTAMAQANVLDSKTSYLKRLIEFEQTSPTYFGVDSLTLISAIDGINSKRLLTELEVDSLTDVFAKTIQKPLSTALNDLYSGAPLVKSLRNDMAEFTNHMQEAFAYKYLRSDMDTAKATEVLRGMLKDLGKTTEAADANVVADILGYADKFNNGYSLKSIVEALSYKGYVKSHLGKLKAIDNIVPKIDIGNGKKVSMITMAGYAGYKSSVNFKAPTPFQVFQPVMTIAHDALIMGESFRRGATNISDAFVAGDMLPELARDANGWFSAVIKNNNQYDMMRRTFTEQMDTLSDYLSDKSLGKQVDDWLATQNSLKGAGTVKEYIVESHKKKRSGKRLRDPNIVAERLTRFDEYAEKVEANKRANFDDNMEIHNYSDGSTSTVTRFGDSNTLTKSDTTVKDYFGNRNYDFLLKGLEDVDYKTAQQIGRFYDHTTGESMAVSDVFVSFGKASSRSFDTKSKTGDVIHSVEIKHDKFSIDALREIVHELTHVAVNRNSHYLTQVQENLVKLVSDGRLTDVDGNAVGFAMDTNGIKNGEPIAQLMHQLYTNELLMNNPRELGKAAGEKNLRKHIEPLMLDGAEIYTIRDMAEYYRKTGNPEFSNNLTKIANAVNGSFNSNVDIRAFVNGAAREKFNTVLKDANVYVMSGRKLISETNAKVGAISISDLFTLDPSKDAVEYALSLKAGGDNQLQAMVANFNKAIQPLVEKADAPNFDRNVGNLALTGAHLFLDELKSATNSGDFVASVGKLLGKESSKMAKVFEGKKSKLDNFERNIYKLAMGKDTSLTAQKVADRALQDLYPTDMDKVYANRKAFKDFVERKAAYTRIQKYESSIGSAFSDLTNPTYRKDAIDLLTMLKVDYPNSSTLFGTNVMYDLSANHMRGYAVKKADFSGDKGHVIGSTNLRGEDYYVVAKNDDSFIVGTQESQLMDMDVGDASKGIYSIKTPDGYVTVNPQNLNPTNKYVDTSISHMLSRNMYLTQTKDINRDLAFKQFEVLKDAGVLMTEESYNKLEEGVKSGYQKLGDKAHRKNPFTKQFGNHYYNKKWVNYFEGSKGFNLSQKKLSKLFGEQFAPFVQGAAKLVIGATQAIKTPILVYRTSSYVNSLISNMMIYGINSDDPLSPMKRYSQAKGLYTEYKKLLSDAVDAGLNGGDRAAAMKALNEHELHDAFMSGIASTIRSDAYNTGSYKENILYTELQRITGDSRMSDQMKVILADPSTEWGARIGEVFDNTEVIPKLMMYLSNKEAAGSKGAIQQVLLAYPTYNNLNPILNAIDQISPFTKYLSNYPKMTLYALSQNPGKLAAAEALFFLGVRGSYGDEITEDEQFWYENNFVNVFGYGGKSWESMNPYWVPSKQLDGFSVVDYAFLPSATTSLANPVKDILPFTPGSN